MMREVKISPANLRKAYSGAQHAALNSQQAVTLTMQAHTCIKTHTVHIVQTSTVCTLCILAAVFLTS